MDRTQFIRRALLLAACAGAALAQTPASVTIVSGNGQMICQNCTGTEVLTFQPLTVEVTDANGNPINGATVNWAITSGGQFGQLLTTVSVTGANGQTTATYFPFSTVGVGEGGATYPFTQTTITATAGTASANLYLTQVLADLAGNNYVTVQGISNVVQGTQISGPVGTTASSPFVIAISAEGQAVPNVAVNLFNLQCGSTVNCPSGAPVGATAQCAAGAGAGTGTVLTNASGEATCNAVLGGVPGSSGTFYLLVGAPLQTDPLTSLTQGSLDDYEGFGQFSVSVSAATPTALQVTSGNGQQVQAGQALPQPLAVTLLTTGNVGLAGQTINWSVSPSGAATLGSTSSTTGVNGQATDTATLSASASGTVTITATAAGTALAPATFTITAIPLITATGLSVVSGSSQTIAEGATSAPLTVQLNGTNSQVIPNVAVLWTITGPGTLSQPSVNTGSNGQASVTVTAGQTAGTITVTAAVEGFSQHFTLTVTPPGPQITASSFMNGADFQVGSLSPCSIATIIAPGVAPGLTTVFSGDNLVGGLPYSLGGDSVTVNGGQAPIYNVGTNPAGQQQLTFQVPCDAVPGSSTPIAVTVGTAQPVSVNVALEAASPGVFENTMTDGVLRAVVERPDGSYVSLTNPARHGEPLIAFATGLGPSVPSVATNNVPEPGAVDTPQDTVVVGMAGQGIPAGTIQLSPFLQGVWTLPFTIPSSVVSTNYPACGEGYCVSFSISVIPSGSGTPISSGTTTIPVTSN